MPNIKKAKKPYQVFISHATADKWIATIFCEKIEATGAKAFRDDRDIDGGEDIPDRIRTEMKRSNELVLLLTPHSARADSDWVRIEAGAAWGWKKIQITAVMCHSNVDQLPGIIKSKKAININEFPEFCIQLASRVKQYHEKK